MDNGPNSGSSCQQIEDVDEDVCVGGEVRIMRKRCVVECERVSEELEKLAGLEGKSTIRKETKKQKKQNGKQTKNKRKNEMWVGCSNASFVPSFLFVLWTVVGMQCSIFTAFWK